MKFLRHPEFAMMLESALKAIEVLNSSDEKQLNEFTSEVLSKRNNSKEYHSALNMFVKNNSKRKTF
jgi:hypothetical protein